MLSRIINDGADTMFSRSQTLRTNLTARKPCCPFLNGGMNPKTAKNRTVFHYLDVFVGLDGSAQSLFQQSRVFRGNPKSLDYIEFDFGAMSFIWRRVVNSRCTTKPIILTSIFFGSLVWLSASANGDPVTFTYSGSGASGSIGGTGFSNVAFTITALGDTSNREFDSPDLLILHDSASIVIDGVGTYDFVTATETFFNDTLDRVGFSKPAPNGGELYHIGTYAPLDGWDMLSSVGPINAPLTLVGWDFIVVNTSGGQLVFNDQVIDDGVFQASVFSIPEPTSTTILGVVAMSGLLIRSRRRPR